MIALIKFLKSGGLLLALTLALALALEASARADVVAATITPNPNNTFNNGLGFSVGWKFTANTNMTVTQLGYFANPNLTESHNVAIYTAAGSIVTATTVVAADPRTANFRYHLLPTPVTLMAGQMYWIMGSSGLVDPYAFQVTTLTTNPALTYVQSGFTAGNSLAFPASFPGSPNSYFGPDFQFTAVPEPSTPGLCGVMAMSGVVIAWRKRRRLA
jgi:uncharacterized protein DUF4082